MIATDASPAMVDLAREYVPSIPIEVLSVPDDPIPAADAIVSVGHPLSYLDNKPQVEEALVAISDALEPGGMLVLDICDIEWGTARRGQSPRVWFGDDWVLVTRTSVPEPHTFRREMTMFVKSGDLWRRDDEIHDNVLLHTDQIPAFLATHGIEAEVKPRFGDETLSTGLVAVIGRRPPA